MHGKSLCLGIFIIHENAFFFSGKCHTIDVVFLHLVNQNLRKDLPLAKKRINTGEQRAISNEPLL